MAIISATGIAEQARHVLVLRGRLQLFAQHGVLEEEELECDHDHGHREYHQILAVEEYRADLNATGDHVVEPLWLRAENRQHGVLQEDGCSQGGNDDGQEAAMAQRVIHAIVEDEAEDPHAQQCEHEGKPVGEAHADQEGNHHVRAEHGEIACAKFTTLVARMMSTKPSADQRVDAAQREALEQHLQIIG
jgi:hypothetical protein